MKNINQIDIGNKSVLIRVDYNVPIINGAIANTFRIDASFETIRYCLENNCKIIIMSHLGRPQGFEDKCSLRPVFEYLEGIFEGRVLFSDDCIGENAIKQSQQMNKGEIHLLENLRFHAEELSCDKAFSKKLSEHGEIFINDAFGTAHRSHASNVGVTRFFNKKACGFLVRKEVKYLDEIIKNKAGKMILLLGGAKISDKIKLISRFENIADKILIGGAMSNNFLKSQNLNVGRSLVERDYLQFAKEILKKNKDKIVLPLDFVCSKDILCDKDSRVSSCDGIKDDELTVDIGPETISYFKHIIKQADCIIWNGPMGIVEQKKFSLGTKEIVNLIKEVTASGATSIIGGGDTSSIINRNDFVKFSHISTGGGASLKLLGGQRMAAFEALE